MAGNGSLVEAGEECRELGNLPVRVHPSGAPTSLYTMFAEPPICFVRRYPLGKEFDAEKANYPGVSRDSKGVAIGIRQKILHKDRVCGGWIEWTQGLTPRDHLEMRLDREAIERQQKFQADERERADARYAIELQRADDRARRSEKVTRHGQWLQFASVLIALGVAVIAFLTFRSRGNPEPIVVEVEMQPATPHAASQP
jgi:hypothetical protein